MNLNVNWHNCLVDSQLTCIKEHKNLHKFLAKHADTWKILQKQLI